MPEIRFYATAEESLQMLQALMARRDLLAYPNAQVLDEPTPKVYREVTAEIGRELLANEPAVLLAGAFSTMQPPYLARLRSGPNAGRYFLCDTCGGPHVLYRLASLSEGGILRQGSLWTQSYYSLTDTTSTGPTPALKAAYADMVKQLKQHLVRFQGLYLSPGALQLLKDGQAELPGADKPLGVLIRDAAKLPQLKPVPPSSRKTTRRKVAARTAR